MADELLNGMKAFVIGPIGDEDALPGSDRSIDYERARQVLDTVIRPACAAHNIPVTRADEITKAGEITEQIYRYLRDSPLVIADLTGANPNVMYELGLRHSTGKLTIPIGERGHLPFDIHAIRTILFERSDIGLAKARTRLITMLGTALTDGADPVTATRVWMEIGIVAATSVLADGANDTVDDLPAIDDVDMSAIPSDVATSAEDDAPGFLELLADLEESLPNLSQNLQLATSILDGITETFEDGTKETQSALTARDKLLVANRLTQKLGTFATRLSVAANGVSTDVERFESGLAALANTWNGQDGEDRSEFEAAITGLSKAAIDSIPGADGFRQSLLNMNGHATSQIRTVYKRIAQALSVLINASTRVSRWKDMLPAPKAGE